MSIKQESEELLTLDGRRERGVLDAAGERRRRELLDRLVGAYREPPPQSRERRRFLRVSAPELSVRFRVGEASLQSRVEDISLGGLSLAEHLWVVAGQQMRVEAVVVGTIEYPLRARARVIWRLSREALPCAGLELVELDPTARAQVREVFEVLFIAHLKQTANAAEATAEPDDFNP